MNTHRESLDTRILKWGAVTAFVLLIAAFVAGPRVDGRTTATDQREMTHSASSTATSAQIDG